MDAVNELSCDFAANVLTRMNTNKQISPQQAINLIRNFYKALSPLMDQNNRDSAEKFLVNDTNRLSEQSASSGH